MKKLSDLTFEEIQQMHRYALGKAEIFRKQAQEHVGKERSGC